jgi:hypothetical protein
MVTVISQTLPLAIIMAIAPMPIMLVTALLLTPRGIVKGQAFVAGWVLGVFASTLTLCYLPMIPGATAIRYLLETIGSNSLLQLLIGLACLAAGFLLWCRAASPMRDTAPGRTPAWQQQLVELPPLVLVLAGLLFSVINGKNAALIVATAAIATQADLPLAQSMVVALVLAVVGALGAVAPVILSRRYGEQADAHLERWRAKVARVGSAVTTTVLVIAGGLLTGRGLIGLVQ